MRLYSTLQHQLVELPPPPATVGIYVCGPTVYQRIHVGNARPYVIFLWLKRWLRQRGYEVKLVSNITDVNDKIYGEATRKKLKSDALAAQATAQYIEDTDRLGLGRPDAEPKATDTMDEIIGLIAELVASGHAYEAQGDVYFRVGSFEAIAEHSMCQPGRPLPQGESQLVSSPSLVAFQRAKSRGSSLSGFGSCSVIWSGFWPESWP